MYCIFIGFYTNNVKPLQKVNSIFDLHYKAIQLDLFPKHLIIVDRSDCGSLPSIFYLP